MNIGELFECNTYDLPLEEDLSKIEDYLLYEAEMISEIAYKSNIGIMELSAFMSKASEQQKKQLQDMIAKKDVDGVWDLVFQVTGMKIMR